MKIYKIISDEKPKTCMECPLFTKKEISDCGKLEEKEEDGGWKTGCRVPDYRCVIEVWRF